MILLYASRFGMRAIDFICDYLRNRKQSSNIDNAYSSWQNILYGVPKGSIFGPFFLNIALCDLLLIMNHEDIAKYADDNTSYIKQMTIRSTLSR